MMLGSVGNEMKDISNRSYRSDTHSHQTCSQCQDLAFRECQRSHQERLQSQQRTHQTLGVSLDYLSSIGRLERLGSGTVPVSQLVWKRPLLKLARLNASRCTNLN